MGVTFKGGTSGNREDAIPSVPSSGSAQPVLDTSGSQKSPGVVWQSESFKNKHREQALPDFMPSSGGIPEGSTDVEDPTATQGGWGPGVQTSKSTYSGPNT